MWIVIGRPDGTYVRQSIDTSIEEHQAKLVPGYKIVGTVSLCDHTGAGGFVSPLNGTSLMGELLKAHGDELLDWMKLQKVAFADADGLIQP